MKALTPHFVYSAIDWVKHSPALIKEKSILTFTFLKAHFIKMFGFVGRYNTMIRGNIVGIQIYLRSEEFKHKKKSDFILDPLKKFKTDPIKATGVLSLCLFLGSAGYFIYSNTQKIIVGTRALRAPASMVAEEPIVEFKNITYKAGEQSFTLNITLEAYSLEEKDQLVSKEKEIHEHLQGIHTLVTQLPLTHEDFEAIKATIIAEIKTVKIKSVELKQVLGGRPKYFLQSEKTYKLMDTNLQLFLEDTRRNRQIWVDFSALASNRNVVLFLKAHEVELRDHINSYVEPVIPQLPIEDEGRQIIKDKLRIEINEYLKKSHIEGSIQEIFIDYIIVT